MINKKIILMISAISALVISSAMASAMESEGYNAFSFSYGNFNNNYKNNLNYRTNNNIGDSLQFNWDDQAYKKAKDYIKTMAFSKEGLMQLLESSEKFTKVQAKQAVQKLESEGMLK